MNYYFAPLEGVTGSEFRRAHHRWFPGVDAYYMPFLSPTQDHVFTQRERRNVLPEYNQGFRAVPQLLTKNAELLKQNSAEAARESERGIVDLETLKKVNADLISTIEETIKIQQEGRAARVPDALEAVKQDLKALNSGVEVDQQEYDEVVAIKAMFLNEDYQ